MNAEPHKPHKLISFTLGFQSRVTLPILQHTNQQLCRSSFSLALGAEAGEPKRGVEEALALVSAWETTGRMA
jgi:hypothetical protein